MNVKMSRDDAKAYVDGIYRASRQSVAATGE